MASSYRFRSFIYSAISIALAAVYAVADFVSSGFAAAVAWAQDAFIWKPDHNAALALDRLAHAVMVVLPTQAARFRSWITRHIDHDEFVGDHFDPGRVFAS